MFLAVLLNYTLAHIAFIF